MHKRTRYFMLGAFTFLVAGLCTGLFAYYGGLPPALGAQEGPTELAYVPADVTVVGYADVREVMSSELRRHLRDVLPKGHTDKGREEFQRETGIDIENDIDHVVIAMLPASEGRDGGFASFRGRFDESRLEALAIQHGATTATYKGKRLLTLPDKGHGHDAADGDKSDGEADPAVKAHPPGPRPTMVLAFVEPGVVMFGESSSVRLALDTKESGRNVTTNAEIMAQVRDASADANAWAVGRFDVLASRAKLPEGINAQIPAIRWFAASGRVNGGVTGRVRAEARDEQAAQNLRDVINGFIALGRMQSGNRPEVQTLLQTLALGGAGKTVEVSFTVPADLIDALAGKAGRAAH